jgi:hypothetical protein
LNTECGEEVVCNLDCHQLPGLTRTRQFVLNRAVEGLIAGYSLKRLCVALEFLVSINGIGLRGKSGTGSNLLGKRLAS